ncbi:MAG: RagB/SusD family nutrient uptake outer membrane protein [Bacteroidota bacterium]
MKRKILIISGVLLLLFSNSCEDILIEEPKDRILYSNYFQDMETLDAAISGVYGQLVTNNWKRSLGSASSRSLFTGADDWTAQPAGNKRPWRIGDQLSIGAADTRVSGPGWNLPYDVILQANFSMEGRDILEGMGYDPEVLNEKISEVYFLRAWSYFWLVRLYGGVPIVLSTDPDNKFPSRASVEEVYEQILSDLDFALEFLPEIPLERGRVSRWAAKAMRSKVYLTMASWPLKQGDKYALALQDAEDIINTGPFEMEPVFADLFDIDNEYNNEYIWQLRFCPTDECGLSINSTLGAQTTKPGELGGYQDLFIEKGYYNRFPEGARKDHSFLSYLVSETGDTIKWENFIWQHPFFSKYYSGAIDKYAPYEPQKGGTSSGLDHPVYRLSEIYMIYAEAQVMGGGGDAALALEYVNMIRRRAKGVDISAPDTDDLTALDFDIIIDERGWEFLGEMKRWFDLTRTEKLAEALSYRDPSEMPLIGDPANKNLYYHPIPQRDMELNTNLEPNPR